MKRFISQQFAGQDGFTLVEMMVSIAVFSIVMVVAMGALLNVIDADQKAQSLKTAINNVNFALESISKDMRVGTHYACGTGNTIGTINTASPNCTGGGGQIIRYESQRAYTNPDMSHKNAYYRYNIANQQIESCLEKLSTDTCTDGSFVPITSSEVKITNLKFYVTGASDPNAIPPVKAPNKTQARMVLTLTGTAGVKQKIQTTFDLQTSVSQRSRE